MCQFVKDNGEQCGRDAEPFCFQHDDTEQAAKYTDSMTVSQAIADAQSDFSAVVMENHCGSCETPLRRTERLREHPQMPHRMLIEAVMKCDCDEHVFATKGVHKDSLPNGWL